MVPKPSAIPKATTTKATATTTIAKVQTAVTKEIKTFDDIISLLDCLSDNVHGNTSINKFKNQFAIVKTVLEDDKSKAEKEIKELKEIVEIQSAILNENEQLKAELNRRQNESSKFVSIEEENEELKNKIKMLSEELMKIKAEKFDEIYKTKITYSSMAQKNNQKTIQKSETKNQPNYNLIISPKDDEKIENSNQTLTMFNKKLNTSKMISHGIRIIKQKPIHKKKVLVKCESPEDINNIAKIIEGDSNIKADIPKNKNPKVQIFGIPKYIEKNEILECIKAQNPNISKSLMENETEELKLIFEKDDRVGTKFAILEATPITWQTIIDSKRIYIGHAACTAKEKISVMQCFKCYRYGHRARDCRNDVTCGKCAGKHDTKNCQSNQIKCTNCSWHNSRENINKKHDENHMATSSHCPIYAIAVNKARSKTNYV